MRCALVTSLCLASLLAGCAPEGPSAYVSKALILDSSCDLNVDDVKGLASGAYDIAGSTSQKSVSCQRSYYLNLVVNSQLKANANTATGRSEPNVLLINEAEISLIDLEQQGLIVFDKRSNELPNPFRVKTNITLEPTTGADPTRGSVPIEAIPLGYSDQLTDYVGKQIMAEVQIFGTTLGDVDIDFAKFQFPVFICQGCMTKCLSKIKDGDTQMDVYGDNCNDNAGADGRVCVNSEC
ncbi:MAG TPA: hypothetical protein VFG30_17755 [Polyangiales bacterium]|nr:hypothetical protein [Polyangiales bacterium]